MKKTKAAAALQAAVLQAAALQAAVRAVGMPMADGTAVDQARAFLAAAAEIEQSLLVQYLYAAYSLDRTAPGVSSWYAKVVAIAIEEMGHLISVQNLLLAVGGTPFFGRESPRPELDPFAFRLQPLTLGTLAKYVTTESPLPDQLAAEAPDVLARARPAFELAQLTTGPAGSTPGINRVGVLYARLYWLFQSGETPEGPWALPDGVFPNVHLKDGVGGDFTFGPPNSVDPGEVQGTGEPSHSDRIVYVARVGSRADALTALYFIASQGEGWVNDPARASHFERFLALFEQYPGVADVGTEPVLPVPTNPSTSDSVLADRIAERNRIVHPASRLWALLFDARYQILVGELWLATLLPKGDALRAYLFSEAIETEMRRAVREIGAKLARLPRGTTTGSSETFKTAGAPFRLPELASLPVDAAGWKQFLRARVAATMALRARLESPENTIPLSTQDRSLLDNLGAKDTDLLGNLGS